jgi:circadian clock protein KaiB
MKTDPEERTATASFEQALANDRQERYVLRLFVSGMTASSLRAIQNIKRICREHLAGRVDLEVIDVYQQPGLGKSEQIVAAPTLIKKLPLPLRRFIGDLSDRDKVLLGLNVSVEDTGASESG